jgi:ubiquitin carboxyl-terminal hydrolase 5/13
MSSRGHGRPRPLTYPLGCLLTLLGMGVGASLRTFQAFGAPFVQRDHERTGNVLYLHLRRVPVAPAAAADADGAAAPPPEKKKPRQLALGGESGFPLDDQPAWAETQTLVLLPERAVLPLPHPDLPELVRMVVDAVLAAPSASRTDDVMAWTAEPRAVSKCVHPARKGEREGYGRRGGPGTHSPIHNQRLLTVTGASVCVRVCVCLCVSVGRHATTLVQLDNGVRIPPSGWQCSQCVLKENLWLNLTDGAILCGRRNWDGSGGNGHALEVRAGRFIRPAPTHLAISTTHSSSRACCAVG